MKKISTIHFLNNLICKLLRFPLIPNLLTHKIIFKYLQPNFSLAQVSQAQSIRALCEHHDDVPVSLNPSLTSGNTFRYTKVLQKLTRLVSKKNKNKIDSDKQQLDRFPQGRKSKLKFSHLQLRKLKSRRILYLILRVVRKKDRIRVLFCFKFFSSQQKIQKNYHL